MINPLENPKNISQDINADVTNLIRNSFQKDGKLDFFSALSHLEECITYKNLKRSKIVAYYCVNMVIGNQGMTEKDKEELVNDIRKLVSDLEYECSYPDA